MFAIKHKFQLLLFIALAMLLGGCSKEKPTLVQTGPISAKTYLATIDGDRAITVGEVLTKYKELTAPSSAISATPENAYEEVLYNKLAFLNADDYDDYDPKEIHRLTKNRFHDVLMQYIYKELISSKVNISESSIDSIYQANIASFTSPERRRVTHILMSENPKAWEAAGVDVTGMSVEQLRQKAKVEIDRLYSQVKAGSNIADLAEKYSHDSNSKVKRGDSGWFTRPEMVESFSDAAFKLPVGQVSKPFESVYGWHILRVDSAQSAHTQPLDSTLRAHIRGQFRSQEEARLGQVLVDSVVNHSTFEWNESLLQKQPGEYDPYDWVCIVNGTDTVDAIVLRERELMYRTRMRTSDISTDTRKDIVLHQITPFALISFARQLGYTELDTMKTAYKTFKKAEIVNRLYRDRVPLEMNWTDEDLERYYNSHQGEFKSDKPVNVQHIVFQDSASALQALDEIKAGADFKSVAMKYYPGEEDFKQVAFDLGWIDRDDVSPEIYDRAWVSPVGAVVGPQRTQFGFHLIKVIDKKEQLDFQSAKAEVRRMMRSEAYKKQEEKWIANLKKGHDIVRLDDIWTKVDFAQPDQYFEIADSLQRAQSPSAAGSGN